MKNNNVKKKRNKQKDVEDGNVNDNDNKGNEKIERERERERESGGEVYKSLTINFHFIKHDFKGYAKILFSKRAKHLTSRFGDKAK